jgi:hypothetical protein
MLSSNSIRINNNHIKDDSDVNNTICNFINHIIAKLHDDRCLSVHTELINGKLNNTKEHETSYDRYLDAEVDNGIRRRL